MCWSTMSARPLSTRSAASARADAVLAVSFSPYNSITPDLVAVAHERNAQIVAITDSTFSPLVSCRTSGGGDRIRFAGFRSLAASLAVGMALVHGVAARRAQCGVTCSIDYREMHSILKKIENSFREGHVEARIDGSGIVTGRSCRSDAECGELLGKSTRRSAVTARRLPAAVQQPAYDRRRFRPGWPISASARSTAATRPNTPTICSASASTAGASSASTFAAHDLPKRSAANPASTRAWSAGQPRRGARHRQHRLRRRQPGQRGAGAGSACLARDRRGHHDGDRKRLLPQAIQRRARSGSPRHRPRPRQPRSAAQPSRPHCARAGAADEFAWPSGHADELRQHPGQWRHPRQRRQAP